MAERTVFCKKLKSELPGLDLPPFKGPLGQEIFENVSAEAWRVWKDDVMIKVINEYRLNLAEMDDYNALIGQMRVYLGLESETPVAEIENPERGRTHS